MFVSVTEWKSADQKGLASAINKAGNCREGAISRASALSRQRPVSTRLAPCCELRSITNIDLRCGQPLPQKCSDGAQCLVSGVEVSDAVDEPVRHSYPNVESCVDAGSDGALHITPRVVEQHFINVNSGWGACTPAPLPASRRSTHFKPLGILKSPHATTACGAPSRSSDLNGQGRPPLQRGEGLNVV